MDVERVLRPRTLCSSVGRRRRAIYIDPADPLAEAHLKANWQSTRLDSFFYGSYFTNGVQDVVAILRSSAGPSVRRSCNALFVSRLVAFPGSLRMLAKVDGRAKLLRSYGIKREHDHGPTWSNSTGLHPSHSRTPSPSSLLATSTTEENRRSTSKERGRGVVTLSNDLCAFGGLNEEEATPHPRRTTPATTGYHHATCCCFRGSSTSPRLGLVTLDSAVGD